MKKSPGIIHFLTIFLVLGLIVAIGFGAFLYVRQTGSPIITKKNNDTTTPNSNSETKWVDYSNKELSFSISYPPEWSLEFSKTDASSPGGHPQISDKGDNLTISHNNYRLVIEFPETYNPNICIYDDESRDKPGNSYCEGEFKEFYGKDNEIYRRLVKPYTIGGNWWLIHTKDGDQYTNWPSVKYFAPPDYQDGKINLMDQILSTFESEDEPKNTPITWKTYSNSEVPLVFKSPTTAIFSPSLDQATIQTAYPIVYSGPFVDPQKLELCSGSFPNPDTCINPNWQAEPIETTTLASLPAITFYIHPKGQDSPILQVIQLTDGSFSIAHPVDGAGLQDNFQKILATMQLRNDNAVNY